MSESRDYQRRAHLAIPGGAHTYSRGDDQYPSNAPPILSHGKGAYTWDLDGNKFLDYAMALRAITVGYDYDRISEAAIREIRKGNNLSRPSRTEVDAAEILLSTVPNIEMVKFAKNGSSVTSAAVKLARAYTGRTMIARCAQHPFYSYDDWFIGDTAMASGIPEEIRKLTVRFNYNDPKSLQEQFEKNPGKIAAVIMEPATTDEPAPAPELGPGKNFLHQVRALCEKYGAVFILDETITGFRWDLGGAAKVYGISADLVTFGKGMANGFSVAALAGKKDIMRLGGLDHDKERVFLISTTHGAEMSGLGAFMETVKVYKELNVTGHFRKYGARLKSGMAELAREAGIGEYFRLIGPDWYPGFLTLDKNKEVSMEFRTIFLQEMIRKGVLIQGLSMCYSHQETELQMTFSAAKEAFKIYARGLEGNPLEFIDGPVVKPVFRKFN